MANPTSGSQDKSFMAELIDQISGDFSWVLEWVEQNCEPDDIFDEKRLEQWARDNGFIKSDECE